MVIIRFFLNNNGNSRFIFWMILYFYELVKASAVAALDDLSDNPPPGLKIKQSRIAIFASYFLRQFSGFHTLIFCSG